jgi:hypothetical protein
MVKEISLSRQMLKRVVAALTMFILIIISAGCNKDTSSSYYYGNDEDSIIKAIKAYGNIAISNNDIVGIEDINNFRIVGYFYGYKHGLAIFEKNKQGNYRFVHAGLSYTTSDDGEMVCYDVEQEATNLKGSVLSEENRRIWAYLSRGNGVAKIELYVNDKMYSKEIKTDKPSLTIIMDEFIETRIGDLETKTIFYNASGEIVQTR